MKGSGAAGNSLRAAPRSPPCESGAAISRGSMAVALTLLALLIELAVGYPERLVRAIGHPVTWIGRLIGTLDRAWNRDAASDRARRVRGALAVALIVATAGAAGYGLQRGLSALPYGIVAAALCASSSSATVSRPRAPRWQTSSVATRPRWTRAEWHALRSRAWRRIFPTAWSRRSFGWRSPACPAPPSTRRSTRPTA